MEQLRFGFAKRHHVLLDGARLLASHQAGQQAILEAMRAAGRVLNVLRVPPSEFESRLRVLYTEKAGAVSNGFEELGETLELAATLAQVSEQADLLDNDDDAPVIRMLNSILAEALRKQASDIHLDLYEKTARIRFRLDGVLQTMLEPAPALVSRLIARIKVLSKLNIAEKRLPQDGRITVHLGGRGIDLRISTLPSIHGERVVMRVLEKQEQRLSMADLGLDTNGVAALTTLMARPNGIVLVTGPTGAGKTTTLYAALQMLDANELNIMTVEDPVEYKLPGISQTPISSKAGMTFSTGLRAILRQDPDVILVGEIRDGETAEIATQASLTGHLVLSTLHTNTAAGAITRLRDLGVDNFLLSATLRGVISQRLVRRLCSSCRREVVPNIQQQQLFANQQLAQPSHFWQAVGCEACNHTGYHGRRALYEMVVLTPELQQMIHDDAGELALERKIRETHKSMLQQGLALVAAGETSFEEVMKVTLV